MAGAEHRPLADRVRVEAVEVDERGLPVVIHRVQIRLHHHGLTGRQQRHDVLVGALGVLGGVSSGIMRAGGHARLDDKFVVGLGPPGLARSDERRLDGVRQLEEIALIGVPAQDVRRIENPRDAAGPLQKRLALERVVPGRADDDEVVAGPVDALVIPHGRRGVDAELTECLGERGLVGVELRQLGARGERDPWPRPGARSGAVHATQRSFSSDHVGAG